MPGSWRDSLSSLQSKPCLFPQGTCLLTSITADLWGAFLISCVCHQEEGKLFCILLCLIHCVTSKPATICAPILHSQRSMFHCG